MEKQTKSNNIKNEPLVDWLANVPPQDSDWPTDISPQDFAYKVLPELDYVAQLNSIRYLLKAHNRVEEDSHREIKEADDFAKKTTGITNQHATDEWIDRMHDFVYHSAAISMSAVGMLAPFIESIFHQSFHGIHKEFFSDKEKPIDHIRWEKSNAEKWDCHFFWDKNGRKKDLLKGIIQMADSTGLTPFLPNDIERVLKALFAYRNKMFHCGFEWPIEERKKFWDRIQNESWPKNWFSRSTSNEETWIIYLTSDFIEHCIDTIENVIEALGHFVISKSKL